VNTSYRPAEYWEQLLSSEFTIAGVAHPYLPQSYNRYLYRALERSLRRALGRVHLSSPLPSCRVLDVGSGVGFWLGFWRRLGVTSLNAVDLTETSVERLSREHPDVAVARADVGADDLSRLGSFDVISIVNVLLHITDDECFAAALQNVAGALAPGGVLLVIDPVVVTRAWSLQHDPGANSKARPLDEWRSALTKARLRVVDVLPVTVLLDSPVDSRWARSFRMRMGFWNLLCRALCGREARGAVVGSILFALDAVLVRLARNGPTLKCLVIVAD
jgi:SAM-dependent methyltransferase